MATASNLLKRLAVRRQMRENSLDLISNCLSRSNWRKEDTLCWNTLSVSRGHLEKRISVGDATCTPTHRQKGVVILLSSIGRRVSFFEPSAEITILRSPTSSRFCVLHSIGVWGRDVNQPHFAIVQNSYRPTAFVQLGKGTCLVFTGGWKTKTCVLSISKKHMD